MENFTTNLEKQLWLWLWRSQREIAKKLLKDANDVLIKEGRTDDWPCLQEWNSLNGSSKAIFLSEARELCGIPHEPYLHIVRENEDASEIIEAAYIMYGE